MGCPSEVPYLHAAVSDSKCFDIDADGGYGVDHLIEFEFVEGGGPAWAIRSEEDYFDFSFADFMFDGGEDAAHVI